MKRRILSSIVFMYVVLSSVAYAVDARLDMSAFLSPIDAKVKANCQKIAEAGKKKGRLVGRIGQLGDSITNSMAYFNVALHGIDGNETGVDYSKVVTWLNAGESGWYNTNGKGPEFGNQSGWTVEDAFEYKKDGLCNPELAITRANCSWAVIMYGTNDCKRGVSVSVFKSHLKKYVERVIAQGVVPVLSTIPPMENHLKGTKEFSAEIRSLATEFKIPLIDFEKTILHYQPENWMGTLISKDGIHPSYEGRNFNYENLCTTNGYLLRTKLTFDMAYKVKRIIFENAAAEKGGGKKGKKSKSKKGPKEIPSVEDMKKGKGSKVWGSMKIKLKDKASAPIVRKIKKVCAEGSSLGKLQKKIAKGGKAGEKVSAKFKKKADALSAKLASCDEQIAELTDGEPKTKLQERMVLIRSLFDAECIAAGQKQVEEKAKEEAK